MEIKFTFLCIMCTSQCFHDIYEDINHNNTTVSCTFLYTAADLQNHEKTFNFYM